MANAQSVGTFEEEVQKLARGDSDSLVDFYQGLRALHVHFGRTVKVVRTDPVVELMIGVDNAVILKSHGQTDRLSGYDMMRYAQDRDCDNVVNVAVYDLLDDAWRTANGQDVEGGEVMGSGNK